ncbi:hypothetical protein BDV12DRAFT_182259 [Aspergillus spectabilis]
MADILEGDELLRYWGISYGTVLGATVAAMFPARIDRMVLDGADLDRTFFAVLETCLQAPDGACALAHRRTYPEDLDKDIYNLISSLQVNPLTHEETLINSGLVHTFIRFALCSPNFYPVTARALEDLLSGNVAVFADIYNISVEQGIILTQQPDEATFAILCGDKLFPEQTYTEMAPIFMAFEQESRLQGEIGHIQIPLLVVGNTFNPATPLRSARNITASFEGSVLLEHRGFGVTRTYITRLIRAPPSNGTLPEPGTSCEVDYAPFTPGNLTSALVDLDIWRRRLHRPDRHI